MNSVELRGFLSGLILGDGTIDKGVTNRAFSIKSVNKDFIEYIENILRKHTNFKITVNKKEATEKNGVKRKEYWELRISSHPYFAKKYHYFYDDRRNRIINEEVLRWLTPQGLANWYMSDGYIVRVGIEKGNIVHRRVELATDRYTPKDVDKIVKYLNKTFDFNCRKVKRKRNVYRIRIPLEKSQYFFLLISEYIVDSFKYKMDLCYSYQPEWMCKSYYDLMCSLDNSADHLSKSS